MTQAVAEVELLALEHEGRNEWTLQIAPNDHMEAFLDSGFSGGRFLVSKVHQQGKPRTYRVNTEMLWVLAPHFTNFTEMREGALGPQARWQSSEKPMVCGVCGKDLRESPDCFQVGLDTDPDREWFCKAHWCPACHKVRETNACPRCQKTYCPDCLAVHTKVHAKDRAEEMHWSSQDYGRSPLDDLVKEAMEKAQQRLFFDLEGCTIDYGTTTQTTGFQSNLWGSFGFTQQEAQEAPKNETTKAEQARKNHRYCDKCQAPQQTLCSICYTCPAKSMFCLRCWTEHLAFHDQLNKEKARREGRCFRCQKPLVFARDVGDSEGLCLPCVKEQARAEHRLCEECGTMRPSSYAQCRCQQWLCEICSSKHVVTDCNKRRCTRCQTPLRYGDPDMPGGLCVSCLRDEQSVCEDCSHALNGQPRRSPCSGCGKRLCSSCFTLHVKKHIREDEAARFNKQGPRMGADAFEAFIHNYFGQGSFFGAQGAQAFSSTGLLTQQEIAAYKVLGLQPTKDTVEIKKAYRKLMRRYHPDAPGANNDETVKINNAHDIVEKYLKRQGIDL